MKTTDLIRVPIEGHFFTEDLSENAKRVLGYAFPAECNLLKRVLGDLEIDPFDDWSVYLYQQKLRDRWSNQHSEFEWKKFDLAKFPDAVPEHVLRKALQIAEKIPTAKFVVESLELTHRRERAPSGLSSFSADPFLVVEVGRDRYYIEVWDEPEFEWKGVSDAG